MSDTSPRRRTAGGTLPARAPHLGFSIAPVVISLLVLAVLIGRLAFAPFSIPSGSMVPTVLAGDYVAVSNFSYGLSRHAVPFAPNLFAGRYFASVPARGDVVVFTNPNARDDDYIKRVVGLPGDHVQMRGGRLYLNGQAVSRQPIGSLTLAEDGEPAIQEQEYRETLPGGVSYLIAKISDTGPQNDTPDFVVPEDRLFVLGDNRDNSIDSRFAPDSPDPRLQMANGVGFLPEDDLVGRAELVIFSYHQATSGPAGLRADRFFEAIR